MKKALAFIMVMVMALSVFPLSIFTTMVSATEIATGDIISFGSYPKTKVSDVSLIEALNTQTPDSDNNVNYNGTKYKKIFFTQYNTGSPNWQDDNGYFINTVYWFRYEPVQWRVLSNTSGELFLLAEKIIEARAYNTENTPVVWESCTLRSWLNNEFYNVAFSSAERSKIITSSVVNQGSSNTTDKLFLLSTSESTTASYGLNTSTARITQGTDFSNCSGLLVQSGGTNTGNSGWWLRTPAGTTSKVSYCISDGGGTGEGYSNYCNYFGVRPAFRMNLSTSGFRKITFNANGGMGGLSTVVTAGEPLTAPIMSKTGYSLTGWSPSLPGTVPEEDTTYTAQWSINNYSITFGENGGTAVPAITQSYNSSIEQPSAPTKAGFDFRGWYFDSDLTTAVTWPHTLAENVTFYAKWSLINNYTITFDANGGTGGTSSQMLAGDPLTAPTVIRLGYTFTDWSQAVPAFVPSADSTYVAQWSVNTYTVTFSTSGGSVSPTSITATYGGTYGTLPTPVRPGFTFGGWYTAPYSPPPFSSGTRVFSSTTVTITEAQTLFARWTANTYTINYDGNGFTAGSTAGSSHTYNLAANLTANGFTKTGSTFLGWSTDAGATTATYTDAQSVINITPNPSAIITFYAVWALDPGPTPADYTQLNLLITQAEGLNRAIYTTDSLTAVDEALDDAYDAVAAEYESSMQDTVDGIASTLCNAMNGLVFRSVNYSQVVNTWDYFQSHYVELNYTPESWGAVVDYYNSINWYITDENNGQNVVDNYNMELLRLISLLVFRNADYDAADDAISAIPDNDGGDLAVDWDYLYSAYTNASVTNLANAVNAIVYGKNITEQAVVNGYATAVNAARLALVSLGADYTYLGIALNNAPLWPSSYYTDATYMPYSNALAVGWTLYNNQNLDIAQQDIINNVILLINSTYEALENKDVTYTVKYQTTGGTTITSDVVKNAKAADWITETAPAITGYTPTQASIQQRMTGTSSENIITFTYTLNSCTITFNSNGGSSVAAITQNANTTVAKPADPTRTGYSFGGWYSNAGLTTAVSWPYTLAGNVTFYAKWDINQVYYYWNPNGGTWSDGSTETKRTTTTTPPLLGLSRTGSTFTGWSPSIPVTPPEQSCTFTAQWVANNYTISFDGNGATGGSMSPIQSSGGSVTLPSCGFVKIGYTFAGWATSAGGSALGQTIQVSSSMTLYAIWTVNAYILSFDSNGGTAVMYTIQNYGVAVSQPAAPTKTGFTFGGWYSDVGLTAAVSWPYIVTGDVTFYAKWSISTYNLIFDANGGSGGMFFNYSIPAQTMVSIRFDSKFMYVDFVFPDPSFYLILPGVMLEPPTRQGYTFLGWSMNSFVMPAHDVTVSAVWYPNSPDSVIINFDTDGGSEGSSDLLIPGDPLTAPADPTKAGYTFVAWAPSIPPTVPNDDATYMAMWQINSYNIIFDANGGTGGTSITLDYNSPLTPPAVTRTGFVFEGWSPTVPASVGVEDVTYTAQWRAIGDMNGDGDISAVDALMALRAAAGNVSPTEIQILAADVDKSGSVTSIDALIILRYSAGLITTF